MGVPSVYIVLIDSWVITVLMKPVMYRSRLGFFFFSLKLYLSQIHLQNRYPVCLDLKFLFEVAVY